MFYSNTSRRNGASAYSNVQSPKSTARIHTCAKQIRLESCSGLGCPTRFKTLLCTFSQVLQSHRLLSTEICAVQKHTYLFHTDWHMSHTESYRPTRHFMCSLVHIDSCRWHCPFRSCQAREPRRGVACTISHLKCMVRTRVNDVNVWSQPHIIYY